MTLTSDKIFVKNKDILVVNYECVTNQVTFCIADFGGNVLIRGNYNCISENKLSIKTLEKGLYTLCIIDGDLLAKFRFLKDQ